MESFVPHNGEYSSPKVFIYTELGNLALTYYNTRLRTFEDPQFNHFEFFTEEGELKAVQNDEVMDELYELGFPVLSMPYIDKDSMDFIYRMGVKGLESELKEL